MKKTLFIVNAGEISSDSNGGASVYYSHLHLLFSIGYDVELLVVLWNDDYKYQEEDYKETLPFIKKIHCYKIDYSNKVRGISRLSSAIFNPAKFEYSFINEINNNYLHKITNENKIDLIWCEWRWSAIWTWKANMKVPIIYSHHDWEYKLALLRKKPTLKKHFHTFQKKRVEFKMVKNFDACISGSYTEVKEITRISKKPALYLPTTYKSIDNSLKVNNNPSLIHLGGMQTTANRIGLERFLDTCWNDIKREIPEIKLKVIGSLKHAGESLQKKLNDKQIITFGFVEDLKTVLHPEDIHIIPWEYNTGTRTRIPVVLNHKQVLVATAESVKCFPEINKENSVLCEDLIDMKKQIQDVYFNREKLHLLATKGKETFKSVFETKSQLKKLDDFLKNLQ